MLPTPTRDVPAQAEVTDGDGPVPVDEQRVTSLEQRLAALEEKIATTGPAAAVPAGDTGPGRTAVPSPQTGTPVTAAVSDAATSAPAGGAGGETPTPDVTGRLPVAPATVIPAVPEPEPVPAPDPAPDPLTASSPAPTTGGDAETEKPAAQPAEPPAPRPLTEQEQDSYVVGMMVADYARSVLRTLEKLDVRPDETLLQAGIQDALAGKPRLDEDATRAAMARFQKETDRRQTERDATARQTLAGIAAKGNTLEKKDDRVWTRVKKGGPAVSKQTPLSLSWEGQFYDGKVFDTVNDLRVTRRDVLPEWLQRAIRLAGPGGQVRLTILAGSLEGEANLPAGTARHELVQYTIRVEKD